jgi:hypothetical protein
VLLVFMVQATSTTVLYVRRLSKDRVAFADNRNGLAAVGGLSAGVTSLGIMAINSSWRYTADLPTEIPAVSISDSLADVAVWEEYIIAGFLWFIWSTTSSPTYFPTFVSQISSPSDVWDVYLRPDVGGAIGLSSSAAQFVVSTASVPLAVIVFCSSAFHRSRLLILSVTWPAMFWIVHTSFMTLFLMFMELAQVDCSEVRHGLPRKVCWKDPLAESLWTF